MAAGDAHMFDGVWNFIQWFYLADVYSVTKDTQFYQLFCRKFDLC
jgi:hypothetical protein